MVTTKIERFEDYKITNAHIRFYDEKTKELGESQALGCTGTLTVETELRNVQKTCGGEVIAEVTKATKLNGTVSAHVKPSVAIEVLGLTNDGLAKGVYGYAGKKTARGVITFDVLDMYEEQKKLLAFPQVAFTNGLTLNIESGQDEIAMMEMSYSGLRDENNYFYYQAFVDDLESEDLAEKWHKEFEPKLVSATPVV